MSKEGRDLKCQHSLGHIYNVGFGLYADPCPDQAISTGFISLLLLQINSIKPLYAICFHARPRYGSILSHILLGGLASDGGLYLPETYPQVSAAELNHWHTLTYADLAVEVLKKFATDIPDVDLKALTHKT